MHGLDSHTTRVAALILLDRTLAVTAARMIASVSLLAQASREGWRHNRSAITCFIPAFADQQVGSPRVGRVAAGVRG
jgi:hypothetical protein